MFTLIIKMTTRAILAIAFLLLVGSCNTKQANEVNANGTPKGELAFLLGYDGKLPSDVGLLRNQVVQRRLANMLKDSFQVFIAKTVYDRPIEIVKQDQLLIAQFFSDSDRAMPSADLVIDVELDAMWVEYLSGDTIIEYTDHPSLKKPGMNAD